MPVKMLQSRRAITFPNRGGVSPFEKRRRDAQQQALKEAAALRREEAADKRQLKQDELITKRQIATETRSEQRVTEAKKEARRSLVDAIVASEEAKANESQFTGGGFGPIDPGIAQPPESQPTGLVDDAGDPTSIAAAPVQETVQIPQDATEQISDPQLALGDLPVTEQQVEIPQLDAGAVEAQDPEGIRERDLQSAQIKGEAENRVAKVASGLGIANAQLEKLELEIEIKDKVNKNTPDSFKEFTFNKDGVAVDSKGKVMPDITWTGQPGREFTVGFDSDGNPMSIKRGEQPVTEAFYSRVGNKVEVITPGTESEAEAKEGAVRMPLATALSMQTSIKRQEVLDLQAKAAGILTPNQLSGLWLKEVAETGKVKPKTKAAWIWWLAKGDQNLANKLENQLDLIPLADQPGLVDQLTKDQFKLNGPDPASLYRDNHSQYQATLAAKQYELAERYRLGVLRRYEFHAKGSKDPGLLFGKFQDKNGKWQQMPDKPFDPADQPLADVGIEVPKGPDTSVKAREDLPTRAKRHLPTINRLQPKLAWKYLNEKVPEHLRAGLRAAANPAQRTAFDKLENPPSKEQETQARVEDVHTRLKKIKSPATARRLYKHESAVVRGRIADLAKDDPDLRKKLGLGE